MPAQGNALGAGKRDDPCPERAEHGVQSQRHRSSFFVEAGSRSLLRPFRALVSRVVCLFLICHCPFYEKRRSVKSTSHFFFPAQLPPSFKIVSSPHQFRSSSNSDSSLKLQFPWNNRAFPHRNRKGKGVGLGVGNWGLWSRPPVFPLQNPQRKPVGSARVFCPPRLHLSTIPPLPEPMSRAPPRCSLRPCGSSFYSGSYATGFRAAR
jgi:hypothetical protein